MQTSGASSSPAGEKIAKTSLSGVGAILRRDVLAGSALAIPAVVLTVGTPAYANSGTTTVGLSAPNGRVPAAGGVIVTATVANNGSRVAGAGVSFTGPSGSSVSPSSTTTQSDGTATTTLDLGTPWATPGSQATVTAVADGVSQSQAFTVTGSNVVAKGRQYNAQSTPYQTELAFPSPVKQLTSQISFNNNAPFFVALLEDGTVWAMGDNTTGQLGIGSTTARPGWGPVQGLSGVTQIASGYGSALALLSDGTVMGWGQAGNLGNNNNTDQYLPVHTDSSVMKNVVQIAANGYSSFAVCADGTAFSWGQGPLGDGTNPGSVARLYPARITDLGTNVSFITVQNSAATALMSDGSLMSWGGNGNGQVGDGTNTDRNRPVAVTGLSGVTAITSGTVMALALKNDGTVWGWGRNDRGSLCDGTTVNRNAPVQAQGLAGTVDKLGATAGAGYAQLTDGSLWSWGTGTAGQLGTGGTSNSSVPVSFSLPGGRKLVRFGNASSGSQDLLAITAPV